jgi:hypothetical protein
MSPESILSFYRKNIKYAKGFQITGLPLKFGESIIFTPSGAIRFFSAGEAYGPSDGTYIIIEARDGLRFWSDFAEKDPSAQRISGAKYGSYVSFQKFVEDMRNHMPNHFEWMLWNFV